MTDKEKLKVCNCATLCHAEPNLRSDFHHTHCPQYKTEKKPRLFYFEEAESCWAPVPELIENIVALEQFSYHGEKIDIRFKRADMTDEEYDNMPEI